MSFSVRLIFREIRGTTDFATESACRGTCHPPKAQIVYSGTSNISWAALVSCKQKQTIRNGAGRVHQPPPLLIEDTVEAPIGDLIANADAGADDVP